MADERGGGDNNVNDNMGNQLQLVPGTSWTHLCADGLLGLFDV